MMCMRCSWMWRSAVRWMWPGCVMRCTRWSGRHPNLVARFCAQFDEPVQVISADPVVPWQYIDLGC